MNATHVWNCYPLFLIVRTETVRKAFSSEQSEPKDMNLTPIPDPNLSHVCFWPWKREQGDKRDLGVYGALPYLHRIIAGIPHKSLPIQSRVTVVSLSHRKRKILFPGKNLSTFAAMGEPQQSYLCGSNNIDYFFAWRNTRMLSVDALMLKGCTKSLKSSRLDKTVFSPMFLQTSILLRPFPINWAV